MKRFSFLLFLTLFFDFFHRHSFEFSKLNSLILKKEMKENSKEEEDSCLFCKNFFGSEIEKVKITNFFYCENNQILFQICYKDLRNFSQYKRGPPIIK